MNTPGQDPDDSLDLDDSNFMELDTPLPAGTRSRANNSGRRPGTRSSARIARNTHSSQKQTNNSTTNNPNHSNSPPPNAPTSSSTSFHLGQPPLARKSQTNNKGNNNTSNSKNATDPSSSSSSSNNTTSTSIVPSLDALRRQVHVALYEQGSPSSAIFYADALVTLSTNENNVHKQKDVQLLAKCYAANNEYRRAVALLHRTDCLTMTLEGEIDLECVLLGGDCYAKCDMWGECLELIHPSGLHYNGGNRSEQREDNDGSDYFNPNNTLNEDDDVILGKNFERQLHQMVENEDDEGSRIGQEKTASMLVASLYLLRGRAYEEMDNRERAIEWYRMSLNTNVGCVDAFQRLIHQRMLSNEQEQSLLAELPWKHEDQW